MANGYFERGEIYNIRMDNGVGSEEGVFRPGVIVSSPKGNETSATVLVAYLTRQYRNFSVTMETHATGQRSYILGNQIATVDKGRLKPSPMGTLTNSEINRLDEILEEVFDLGYVDDAALKEKETEIAALQAEKADLKSEVARLKAQLEQRDDSKIIELAMYQRLYEKTLNTLVDMKFTSDVELRGTKNPEPKKLVEEPKQEEPKIEAPVENAGLVDVNSATFTELKKCGLSSNIVLTLIDRRPYKSLDDVKKLPGITNVMWQILVKKICCTPVAVVEEPEQPKKQEPDPCFEKVNVNTATWQELVEVVGMTKTVAFAVTGKRKKCGPYKKLEDLLYEGRFTQYHLDKYGPMLEIG